MTQSQLKIHRTTAKILKMFDWYSTSRLVAVVGHFECQVGADNSGERWRQALLDFSYCNVCFDLKQLIKVLRCDLQVTIHQADILKVIANFVNNFHIEVTTLSAPQVHALLDHMWARCAGSHSFLAAIRRGTTLTRPVFLEEGSYPTNSILLQQPSRPSNRYQKGFNPSDSIRE